MKRTQQVKSYSQSLKYTQDELALQYLPAVKAMAHRLKERLPSSVDFADLISIGTEELIKVARRYDSSLNDSFWGFAKIRVHGAMLDYLRNLDILSRSSRKLIKAIDSEISKYLNEHDEEPSDEYLAQVLHEDIAKIKEAKIASDIYTLIPINEQYSAIQTDSVALKVEQEDLIEQIQQVLSTLSEREQLVMQLYYFEELNLSEISEILNITESRISQINKEVIKKVRLKLGEMYG
ncbi:RNA polymerase sigma factor FliA [Helicobacter kayseriensis]|uniref:RNA polymerase sigma factor FliA n=1 Tax=Helicobacter kayseriensis TaxID=2905877 RepID=UPI001E400F92|nr:RNA polymerase sigma factor FliA [Helicobacter kayseriensis]MCE3046918.1 RNA polymerase sigma factor FliA [Helicobacter kayseriensis]MCE3048422.1 RNA polymerase sigma factor FliA [Helicobacter kayseriensis]